MIGIGRVGEIDVFKDIGKQLVYIEASPAEKKLEELRKSKSDFIDDRFPPTLNSLTG